MRDSQGAVNNGLIISGREVCLGHASNTSLSWSHSLTPGGGGGHSIQLKRNNFLATPREAPTTKPPQHHSHLESQIEKRTNRQKRGNRLAEHAFYHFSLVSHQVFFAHAFPSNIGNFPVASSLVALLKHHSLVGNAGNLYFVFRNPLLTWELTPRPRPLQIPSHSPPL